MVRRTTPLPWHARALPPPPEAAVAPHTDLNDLVEAVRAAAERRDALVDALTAAVLDTARTELRI